MPESKTRQRRDSYQPRAQALGKKVFGNQALKERLNDAPFQGAGRVALLSQG